MGVKHDGSKARFSLFRTLIDFQSKNMARLKQARKYNLTFFGVLDLTGLFYRQLLLTIVVADDIGRNIGYQFHSLSMGVF